MLKRILQIGGALVLAIVIAFGLNKATAVTIDDITSFYELGGARAHPGVQGGDIYAVSPDGLIEEKICALELQEDFVVRQKIAAEFTNSIGEAIPFIVELAKIGSGGQDIDTGAVIHHRMKFAGEFTKLLEDAPIGTNAACEKKMVQRMNARYLICMVRSSLIPTGNSVFSAYRFDSLQIWIPDVTFEKYGSSKSGAAVQNASKTCPQATSIPWDVAFRKSLRIVKPEVARGPAVTSGDEGA
ncbi:hypothetical protein AB0T83_00505 [Fluviibacterium sp. DFM31]|uniref:Uncharacterized protein n=1 Tax=Meridianimarinicoccus marinus TaxID=3231483 RepID=A0ABV3L127_9RHOB